MSTFLDKNKKKGGLASILLFLQRRKGLSALLLLALLASFLFVSPSYMLISVPGGPRLAAGAAWLAGRLGADTSKWGLAVGKRGFGDLLAAFRAAKEGSGKAGWSSFMRGGTEGGAGSGSLDFVKGSRRDLEARGGDEAKLPKAGSVSGILNPDDAKRGGGGDAVALTDEDVTGERAVRSEFTGAGADGGAYANKGFFGGGPSAAETTPRDKANKALGGMKVTPTAGVAIKGGAVGRLSASQAAAIKLRTTRGLTATNTVNGQGAFVELAVGRNRAAISVAPNCAPPACPGEFAATNAGMVYDGNKLSANNGGLISGDDDTDPVIPPDDGDDPTTDPAKLKECQDKLMQCQRDKQPLLVRLGQLQDQLNAWSNQMPHACGDPCDCGPCRRLKSSISGLLNGEFRTVSDQLAADCVLPPFCSDLGIEAPNHTNDTRANELDMRSCGCPDIFCDIGCALGS